MNTTNTAKRRRATTLAQQERILDMATSLPLTKSVLREVMADATTANLDLIETWFGLELEQRARSRKARLIRQAGFPTAKSLDGYDWSRLKMPDDWGVASSRASSSSSTPRTSSSTATSDAARPTSPSPSDASHA